MVLGPGVIAAQFDCDEGTLSAGDIIAATVGNTVFSAVPHYTDMANSTVNCPKNTAELMRLDYWTASVSGRLCSADAGVLKSLAGGADITYGEPDVVSPAQSQSMDFSDIWLIADYSDVNSGAGAGYIAVKLKNALSRDGINFSLQSGDGASSSENAKGIFDFCFTAHTSASNPSVKPFEIYIKSGSNDSDDEE